ncbi:pyocin S6 family toxin immunity protein [Pseudomonas sp. JDS28PS106]|uniref:pyocin S6 family toxin immunity protein n=1 Tax=Pseudomonas sp. JDS28PS106 TaxID=2497235 RepID=UPI002FD28051
MNLNLIGFLPEENEDQFIQCDIDIPRGLESKILEIIKKPNLEELIGGDWPISKDQAQQIAFILNANLPSGLDFFITVVA